MEKEQQLELLKKLRQPFPEHQIGKLPKPSKKQTEAVQQNYRKGVRCNVCGGWHHPEVIHLDYVGHAALTDRLLSVDPLWQWEPLQYGDDGLPLLDRDGGMWIKLTVAGVTRLGYGDAGNSTGPAAMKERIGDALRNAGMRFGIALELWHKGNLDAPPEDPHAEKKMSSFWENKLDNAKVKDLQQLTDWQQKNAKHIKAFLEGGEKSKFNAYFLQYKQNLTPPPGTECPDTGEFMTEADCAASDCGKDPAKCSKTMEI